MRAAKKVWVLWYREYDDTEVMGVYSTKERARKMIWYVVRFSQGRRKKLYFEIEEHGLDAMSVKLDVDIRGIVTIPRGVTIPRWVRR